MTCITAVKVGTQYVLREFSALASQSQAMYQEARKAFLECVPPAADVR